MAHRCRALSRIKRGFSVLAPEAEPSMNIFDRNLKRKQRDRAAYLRTRDDPLLSSVTETLLDRLDDTTRKFPLALNFGGCLDHVQRSLKGRGGVEKLIMMDTSLDILRKSEELNSTNKSPLEYVNLVADDEFIPIQSNSLDLVISCLGLHWVNDLPGALIQCRMALKPDGFFLASMFGGETLRELRIACTLASLEREGGISPRVSPLAQVKDAGNLLTRAGLALPTVDVQDYVMKYPTGVYKPQISRSSFSFAVLDLIDHLRSMGETNCLLDRNKTLRRDTALAAAAVYDEMFRDEDGMIPATFQVIYMAGWSPDSSQQKPARRGSGTVSFADIENMFASKDT